MLSIFKRQPDLSIITIVDSLHKYTRKTDAMQVMLLFFFFWDWINNNKARPPPNKQNCSKWATILAGCCIPSLKICWSISKSLQRGKLVRPRPWIVVACSSVSPSMHTAEAIRTTKLVNNLKRKHQEILYSNQKNQINQKPKTTFVKFLMPVARVVSENAAHGRCPHTSFCCSRWWWCCCCSHEGKGH